MAMVKTKPGMSSCISLMLFVITVATVSKPALVKADHSLLIYVHEDRVSPNRTSLVVVSPTRIFNGSTPAYGAIGIFTDVVREGQAGDSPVLGKAQGEIVFEKDGSLYFSFAYVLKTPTYAGSITVQGVGDALGNGDLAITGGTGDFLWARGYVAFRLVTDKNSQDIVFSSTFYIKYS